jgi:hypothetical protein
LKSKRYVLIRGKTIIAIGLVCSGTFCSLALTVQAQSPQAGAEAQFVASLQVDGSLAVQATFAFPPRHPPLYCIDLGGYDSVEKLRLEEIAATGSKEIPFKSTRLGRTLVISWQNQQEHAKSRLLYTLQGTAAYGKETDVVTWQVIDQSSIVRFDKVSVEILPPTPCAACKNLKGSREMGNGTSTPCVCGGRDFQLAAYSGAKATRCETEIGRAHV